MQKQMIVVGSVVVFLLSLLCTATMAAEMKIGVINMQKVLASSNAGKKAQGIVQKKGEELQAGLKKVEEELIALEKEIKKKQSAWNDEMLQKKGVEFQKKRRDLAIKKEDANLELKNLRDKHVGPILKKLSEVVKKVAQDGGYTLVLPHNVTFYADDSIDLTQTVTKALNKATK
ncbi:MAG: hypothetical protein CSB34_01080 [Desulfobulbus propionicus]|nr:MAG: hypothetical protein CSB34_01080 [Desulfobulbus propionicus]PIE64062.1 MAG: hypothetical protein CSA26_10065 [Desulfobacterales bacterium]